MLDYKAARKNMIDCQIRPAGIVSPEVLQAFGIIPREEFLPQALKNIAYLGETLSTCEGRYLLEPALHARMVEALAPEINDVALDIGGSTGYSAAILSSMVSTVIAIEDSNHCIEEATKIWDELGVCNVAAFESSLMQGHPENSPFDLIFINGAVSKIPITLMEQLVEGGRLVCVLRESKRVPGQVMLVKSLGDKGFSSTILFEATCPYLPGFEPQLVFAFA